MIHQTIYLKHVSHLLILATLLLSACHVVHPNNFNKQKFTNLKPISQERELMNEESNVLVPSQNDNAHSSDNLLVNTGATTEEEKEISFEYSEDVFSVSAEINQSGCDTIITASRKIICTIKKIDKRKITFAHCPENGDLFVIRMEDVKYYSGQPVVEDSNQSEPELQDTTETEEITLPVLKPAEVSAGNHPVQAKKYFLGSLICLLIFALGIFLVVAVVYSGLLFLLAWFAIVTSFIVGYSFLAISAFHSRIYKLTEPDHFKHDAAAKAVYTLTILGMLLFGSVPFLIPFGIVWLIVRSQSNKIAQPKEKSTTEEVIFQKSKRSNVVLGILLSFIFAGILLTTFFL